MESKRNSFRTEGIDVRDEREFKLWVKFIASVHKDGGDINKPIEILWKSVQSEIQSVERRLKRHRFSSTQRGNLLHH
jgi:hypothetical protein